MKTLHIDPKIHENFKKYCKEKGYQINKLTEIIIDEYMKNTNSNLKPTRPSSQIIKEN